MIFHWFYLAECTQISVKSKNLFLRFYVYFWRIRLSVFQWRQRQMLRGVVRRHCREMCQRTGARLGPVATLTTHRTSGRRSTRPDNPSSNDECQSRRGLMQRTAPVSNRQPHASQSEIQFCLSSRVLPPVSFCRPTCGRSKLILSIC